MPLADCPTNCCDCYKDYTVTIPAGEFIVCEHYRELKYTWDAGSYTVTNPNTTPDVCGWYNNNFEVLLHRFERYCIDPGGTCADCPGGWSALSNAYTNITVVCTDHQWGVYLQALTGSPAIGTKAATSCPEGSYSGGVSVGGSPGVPICCPTSCNTCAETYTVAFTSGGFGFGCSEVYTRPVTVTRTGAGACSWTCVIYFSSGGWNYKLEMGISCVLDNDNVVKWNIGAGLFIEDGPYWTTSCQFGAYKTWSSTPIGSYDVQGGSVS
jgi:hypothetical protein